MLRDLFRMSPASAAAKARKIIRDRGADKHLYKLHCGTKDYHRWLEGDAAAKHPNYVFNFGVNDLRMSQATVDDLENGGKRTIRMVGGEFAGVLFNVGGYTIHRGGAAAVDIHLHVGDEIAMNVVYDFGQTSHVVPHDAGINFDLFYDPKGIEVRAYRRSDQMFPFLAKASKSIDRLAEKHSDDTSRIVKQGAANRQAQQFKF